MNPGSFIIRTIAFIILFIIAIGAASRALTGNCIGKDLRAPSVLSEHAQNLCDCSGVEYKAKKFGKEPKMCCMGLTKNCRHVISSSDIGAITDMTAGEFATGPVYLQTELSTSDSEKFFYISFNNPDKKFFDKDAIETTCSSVYTGENVDMIDFNIQEVLHEENIVIISYVIKPRLNAKEDILNCNLIDLNRKTNILTEPFIIKIKD